MWVGRREGAVCLTCFERRKLMAVSALLRKWAFFMFLPFSTGCRSTKRSPD